MRLTPLGKIVVLIFIITIISGFTLIEKEMRGSNVVLAGESSSYETTNIVNTKNLMDSYGIRSVNTNSLKDVVLSINFSPDKAEIKSEYSQAIYMFFEIANTLKDIKIQIEGNTAIDSKYEDYETAKILSLKRAQVTADYLKRMGIEPERIIIIGNGSDKPLGDNRTPEGRLLNRRTDVFFKTN